MGAGIVFKDKLKIAKIGGGDSNDLGINLVSPYNSFSVNIEFYFEYCFFRR